MPDGAPFRRRFQIRLRTLMIGVMVLSVACAYVAHEARIARGRKAWLDAHSQYRNPYPFGPGLFVTTPPIDRNQSPSPIRVWFGDKSWTRIVLPLSTTDADARLASSLFPEAEIIRMD